MWQSISYLFENLFSIFGKAFLKVAKMETAVNSFRKCGIYPFNPDVFSNSDFTASKRDDSLSPSTTTNSESEARITEFRNILKDIMNSNAQSNSKKKTNTSQPSIQSSSKSTNAEGEVRIPLSYIVQAKPLINFLSSCLNSSTGYVPPEQFEDNSDLPIELTLPVLPQIPPQLQNQPAEATINPATHSMIQDNSSLSASQKATVKKGRAKGKTAIITLDKYKEDLIAEKIKNIKKGKAQETPKPVQEADVPLPIMYKSSMPQPQKRKQPSTNTAPRKRKPLVTLNNLLQVNNIATPISQEPIKIIDSESLPLQENGYFIQVGNNVSNPSLLQNYLYYADEHDLQNFNL